MRETKVLENSKKGTVDDINNTNDVRKIMRKMYDKSSPEIKDIVGRMMLFERYVDDSNQMAVVPPPGSKYDAEKQRVVMDPQQDDQHIPADERLAKILLDIANSVMRCVIMEADWPSKNKDLKMPILDMKVWTDADGVLLYQHYEKEVSSKTVLHAHSAHSAACERGVHTQEVLRRLMNCSLSSLRSF